MLVFEITVAEGDGVKTTLTQMGPIIAARLGIGWREYREDMIRLQAKNLVWAKELIKHDTRNGE